MRIRIKAPSAPQLIKELQPHLPLPVYLTPEICQSLSAKGKIVRADEEQLVSSLLDSGDMGGILCALGDADSEQVALVSLTHLRIRPRSSHAFARGSLSTRPHTQIDAPTLNPGATR